MNHRMNQTVPGGNVRAPFVWLALNFVGGCLVSVCLLASPVVLLPGDALERSARIAIIGGWWLLVALMSVAGAFGRKVRGNVDRGRRHPLHRSGAERCSGTGRENGSADLDLPVSKPA